MKIKGEYVLRDIMGENIVVPIGSKTETLNMLIVLNETGTFLWNLLYEGHTKKEIIDKVCEEYEVDAATAEADLDELIKALENNKIVVEGKNV